MHDKTSHCAHEAPQQNLIDEFLFYPSTKGCVADERQVDKNTPARRARASATRASYVLEAARDNRKGRDPRGFRQRDARRGVDFTSVTQNSVCRGCARKLDHEDAKCQTEERHLACRRGKRVCMLELGRRKPRCNATLTSGTFSRATRRPFLRGKNHMPYFNVRVLKIDEPFASCLAGFPEKGRPAVRRAGARDQRLSLVVVVVVFGRR